MIMARFRTFACELYPEDDEHIKVLEYIITYFEYAYILHDKDVWEEEKVDNDGVTIHKVGDLKKPHYHVVLPSLFSYNISCGKHTSTEIDCINDFLINVEIHFV